MIKNIIPLFFLILSFNSFSHTGNCSDYVGVFLKVADVANPTSPEIQKNRSDWLKKHLKISVWDSPDIGLQERLRLVEFGIYEKLSNDKSLYHDPNFFPIALNHLMILYTTYGGYDRFHTILDNIDDKNAKLFFYEPIFNRFTSAAMVSLDYGRGFLKYFLDYNPSPIYTLHDLGEFYPDSDGQDYLAFLNCMQRHNAITFSEKSQGKTP